MNDEKDIKGQKSGESPENGAEPDFLFCSRDYVSVPADKPYCLHPTGQCPYRQQCEIYFQTKKPRK